LTITTTMMWISCYCLVIIGTLLLADVDGLTFNAPNRLIRLSSTTTPINTYADASSATHRVLANDAVDVDDTSICSDDAPWSSSSPLLQPVGRTNRRTMIKTLLPLLAALYLTPSSASAGIDVSGLRVEGGGSSSNASTTTNNTNNIQLAGITYTPAAMMLQMAEQTASMEGIMRESALETKTKTKPQRIEAGSKGEGPGVVGRGDLVQSTDLMIRNSRIAEIAPVAAMTLRGIPRIVEGGKGDMTKDEYLAVAKQYDAAREDLRRAFESMTVEEQMVGKSIVRKLRAKDEEQLEMQRNGS